jgi:squalene-associated FAD-dependent desaturase
VNGGKVVVVGGGLAGISAAIELAEAGLPVCLVEARPWLGGATCSFGRRGLTVDNGQHIFFRSWSAYRDLLTKLGTAEFASIQDELELMVLAEDGQAVLRRSSLPPPLHLVGSLARYRLLSPGERLMLLPAVVGLRKAAARTGAAAGGGAPGDAGFADWLARHGQGERARRMFWEVLSVPALNTEADQADPALAGSLLTSLGLAARDSADIGISSVPLSQLHSRPAATQLSRLGAQVRLCRRVTAIRPGPGGYAVQIESDQDAVSEDQLPFERDEPELVPAAAVVLAIPPWDAARLAPAELAGDAAGWARLDASPIVSLHVIYGGSVTGLRFAATAGLPVRWIVDKTDASGLRSGQYLAASIPAADKYVDTPAGGLREEFLPLLGRLFPAAETAKVEDFFVTRERRATVRQTRAASAFRPSQETSLPGFAVAGAWTDTGVPDTMEGAVRSGRLAARAVISRLAGAAAAEVRADSAADSAGDSDSDAVAATRQ